MCITHLLLTLIQAIGDVKLPCKFAENGCEYVAARTILKEHTDGCSFRPKIACPYWECSNAVFINEVFNHLKNCYKETHVEETNWVRRRYYKHYETACWSPKIVSFEGQTFFLQACTKAHEWMFWAVILGTKENAQKYEVIMSIPCDSGDIGYEITWKVYSTDEEKDDVIKDQEGVLKLDKYFAEIYGSKDADGKLALTLDYEIIRKN